MPFSPPKNKVEIEPIEDSKIIDRGDRRVFREGGKVISVGEDVTYVKPGDFLYFEDWGCTQTTPDPEGKTHWIVWVDEKVILGKYET